LNKQRKHFYASAALAVLLVELIVVQTSPLRAEVLKLPSTSCLGALDVFNVDSDGNKTLMVVEALSGSSVRCISNPGVYVDATGTGISLANVASGLDVGMSGIGNTLVNSGTMRADMSGSNATVINDTGAVLEVYLGGDDSFTVNDGEMISLHIIGNDASVSNSGSAGFGGSRAFGIMVLGNGAEIDNTATGVIDTSGPEPVSILVEGKNTAITNAGLIQSDGFESVAVLLEGDNNRLENDGIIRATGTEAVSVLVEGNDAQIQNAGGILVTGAESAAITIEGERASFENLGQISAEGRLVAGVIALGGSIDLTNRGLVRVNDPTGAGALALGAMGTANSVSNEGRVRTDGDQALGIGGLGQSEIRNSSGGLITTTGSGAHGMFLGLQEAIVPVGLPLPVAMFDPADGKIVNDGTVTTAGAESDAIHGYLSDDDATDIEVTNNGSLETGGSNANAISVSGNNIGVANYGDIKTLGDDSSGIELISDGGVNTIGNLGTIEVLGDRAAGIAASMGSGEISNQGQILATGRESHAIDVSGEAVKLINTGSLEARGELGNGISIREDGDSATKDGIEVVNEGSIEAHQAGVMMDNGLDSMTLINNVSGTIVAETGVAGFAALQTQVRNEGQIIAGAYGVGLTVDESDHAYTSADFTNDGTGAILVDTALSTSSSALAVGVSIAADRVMAWNRGDVTVANAAGGTSTGIELTGSLGEAVESEMRFENTGTIQVTGAGESSAVVMVGDVVTAVNEIKASINTTGDAARGMSGAFASRADLRNDGSIQVTGENATGMALQYLSDTGVVTPPEFSIVNSGALAATGSGAVGIAMVPDAEVNGLPGPIPKSRVISNEDSIDVTGENSAGMRAIAVGSVRIENAGTIRVTGDNAQAISAVLVSDSLLVNANQVSATGANAVGMSVLGDDNIVFNGPLGLFCHDVSCSTYDVISAEIDLSHLPGGPPLPSIMVDGANSVGLLIDGSHNRISNSFVGSPDGGDIEFGLALIQATGTGSIGVDLRQANNAFVNSSMVYGDSLGLRGSEGADTITNLALISGGVDLGGGDDLLEVAAAATFDGRANAGSGVDTLVARATAFLPPDHGIPGGDVFTLIGSDYASFEIFRTIGGGTVNLVDTLRVQGADLTGTTNLVDGAGLAAEIIEIAAGGSLTGNGSVGALPGGDGSFDDSTITVAEAATIAPGNSFGQINILGDLVLGGSLDIEIGGAEDGWYDVIFIEGDVFLENAMINLFLTSEDEFLASFEEDFLSIDFLLASGGIFGDFEISLFGFSPFFDYDVRIGGSGLNFTARIGDDGNPSSVPEPSTLALFGLGLLGLGFARRGD